MSWTVGLFDETAKWAALVEWKQFNIRNRVSRIASIRTNAPQHNIIVREN